MFKIAAIFLTCTMASTVFAEPIIYICERPAWEGVEGCGLNNTYHTYGFFVDTDDFDHNADKDSFRYKRPKYVFAKRKGCDLEGAQGDTGTFTVVEEGIIFWFELNSMVGGPRSRVDLDTISMTATMKNVKHSPNLTCEEIKGESIKAYTGIKGWSGGPVIQPGVLGPTPTTQ